MASDLNHNFCFFKLNCNLWICNGWNEKFVVLKVKLMNKNKLKNLEKIRTNFLNKTGLIWLSDECQDVGIVIQKYMSDNGTTFTAKDFTDHLSIFSQVSKYAGVGAHHHNVQAGRR